MSWSQKLLNVSIDLASNSGTSQPVSLSPGTLQGAGGSATITGARISARIWNAGAPVNCHAEIKVYGLTPSLMNQLATLGLAFNIVPKNTLTLQAGGGAPLGSTLPTVFQGTIYSAYGDYDQQPNVPMVFYCVSGGGAVVSKANANSFQGTTSVATIMQTLASAMKFNFENNGVTATLSNSRLGGTLFDQAAKVARDAGIGWGIINGTTLSIWPLGGSAASLSAVPMVAAPPLGEMIGYPGYTQQGIIVRTLFNPQIQFGGKIQVVSSLPQATGTWAVNKIDHHLESMVRNGQWKSTIYAYNPNFSRTVIAPTTG